MNPQPPMKHPQYETLSKHELITELRTRDRQLTELKERLRSIENGENERIGMFKLKLEEEIAQNEKAVRAFSNITELVLAMITKFQGLDRQTTESLASMRGTVRDSIVSRVAQMENEEDLDESEFSCIDQIVSETVKLLDYLSKLTEDVVKANMNMRSELAKRMRPTHPKSDAFSKQKSIHKEQKKQSADSQAKIKQENKLVEQEFSLKDSGQISNSTGRSWNQQLVQLRQEVQIKMRQAKDCRKLLEEESERRTKLLKNIMNCLSQQNAAKIVGMNRDQLIEHIKMMGYRIKELEKDKREMFAKSKIEKESDQKRFQDLLEQIKEVKNRRLKMSAA